MSETVVAQPLHAPLLDVIALPQPTTWRGLNFWGYWLFAIGALMILPACQLGTSFIKVAEVFLLLGVILLRLPLHRLPGFYIALAFTGWQMVSVAVQGEFPQYLDGTAYNWLCLYAMVYAWQVPWLRKSLFYVCLGALCISATVALLQLSIGYMGSDKPFRIGEGGVLWGHSSGLHSKSLTYGFIMGCYALLFFNEDLWKSVNPYLRYIAVGIAIAAMVLSSCRSATFAFPLAVLAIFIFGGSKKRMVVVSLATVALFVIAVFAMEHVRPGNIERLSAGQDGRWAIWEVSAHMTLDNPVFGAGGNKGFRDIFDQYPGSDASDNMAHAHNIYLSLTAQYGFPALAIFFALLFVICRAAWRLRSDAPSCAYGIIGLGVFLCASGMFDDYIGRSVTSICCFVCMGLMFGCAQRVKFRA